MTHPASSKLPHAAADRVTIPLARFLKVEAAGGGFLLLAVCIAMAAANSPWSDRYLAFWETLIGVGFGPLDYTRTLRHWINDGLMTLFFFLLSLELKRELILGELRNIRQAALPLAGAVGGMAVPVALFLTLMNEEPGAHGWGTVMATDTAFVVGCLALFGRRIPVALRIFLLSLAIFDDVGAILVVAFGYGEAIDWWALGLGLLVFLCVFGAARLGVRNVFSYFVMGGVAWFCLDASGIHATITGVVLGLMTPTRAWVDDARLRKILGTVMDYPAGEHWSGASADRRDLLEAGTAVKEALSPVERLELMLHPWVGFIVMPVFALANAGIAIHRGDFGQPVSIAIMVGLLIGKPIGVICGSWLAVRAGVAVLLPGLSWPIIAAGGVLTGIGFTMSLFIAGLAFDPTMLNAAKLGVLGGSMLSAALGCALLFILTRKTVVPQ